MTTQIFPEGTKEYLIELKQHLDTFIPPEKVAFITEYLPTIPDIADLNQTQLVQISIALLSFYGLYTLSKSIFNYLCPTISIKSLMRLIPGAQGQFKAEVVSQVQGMMKPVMSYDKQLRTLPDTGISPSELLKHCADIKSFDVKPDGSAFAYVYETDFQENNRVVDEIFSLFSNTNALSPLAFPSLRYMENCVVSACAELLHAPFTTENNSNNNNNNNNDESTATTACGVLTSGGTESIICALKTYRDRAVDLWGINNPEIICPITIHPAFTKGAHILGIKIHLIPLDPNNKYKVDMRAYKRKINKNTILLVGSAPAYPHGIIDPISEICQLAKSWKLPVHVDACIGGFFLPFVEMLLQKQNNNNDNTPALPLWDFRLPEVTSISLDLHKYAYTPKGASCIMYRTPDLRKYQYFAQANWPGGLFVSPSLLGTRGGGPIAASWASLQLYGKNGYLSLTKDVLNAKKVFVGAVESVSELEIIGTPLSSIISWKVQDKYMKELSILAIGDALEMTEMVFKDGSKYKPSIKWVIERQQGPNSIHMTLMAQHVHTCGKFQGDLIKAVQYVKENNANMLGKGSAGMYGMVVNVNKVSPTLIEEFLTEFESQVMSPDTREMCEKNMKKPTETKTTTKNTKKKVKNVETDSDSNDEEETIVSRPVTRSSKKKK